MAPSTTSRPTTQTVRSFCRFCEAACGILVDVEQPADGRGDPQVTKVRADPDNPLSKGYTCPKGRNLGVWHHHPDRLDHPSMRGADGSYREVEWDAVLDDIAARIRSIVDESGPDAVGVLLATGSAFDSMGRRIAERLWQQLGSRSKYTSGSVDTPCKPLVSRLMSGFPGLVPTLDPARARLTILIGINPVVSHGHLNGMPDPVNLLRSLADGDREVWVVDPRTSETARLASRHLAVRPGTDHLLLAHAVRELLADGADTDYLARHVDPADVEVIRELVEPWTADRTAAAVGLDTGELGELVAAIRRAGRVSCQTGTGTTMSRTANLTEWMCWLLHIVTGSFDVEGGMWFNPGYLRQLDRRSLGSSGPDPSPGPRSRPELRDWTNEFPCAALVDEIESGNLRALIVLGGNPLRSLPEPDRLGRALSSLDALVVADVVATDTTALATHVLPVTGQLERADITLSIDQFVVTLSTQYTPAVVPAAAQRHPAWWVFASLAQRLGLDVLPAGTTLDSVDEEQLIRAVVERSRGDAELVMNQGWDVVDPVYGWVLERLLPDGRWTAAPELLVDQWRRLAERDPGSLVLIPRRQPRHLNSQLVDGVEHVRNDDPSLLMHPADASARGLVDGQQVIVRSAHGEVSAVLGVSDAIRDGAVSVPHGFGAPNVCWLTSSTADVDEISGMVLQSGIPVEVIAA